MRSTIALLGVLLLACGAPASASPRPPAAGAAPPAGPSSGCGRWTLPRGVSAGSVEVAGVERTFVLSVPERGEGPVPVVFAFHGQDGNGKDFRSWLTWMELERAAAGPTVFVYPDALVGPGGRTGWEDVGGRDVAMFDAILARLEAEACVDRARVFAMGFSFGAVMSNDLGCQRGGVVRAIAPLSGGGPRGACNGRPVAVWIAAGEQDPYFAPTEAAREHWARANGCRAEVAGTSPSPCVAHAGCAGGAPLVWCSFPGKHEVRPWEPPALMRFFDGLR